MTGAAPYTAPCAALVTGGARRIGQALALALAAAGASVAVHHRGGAEAAAALVAALRAAGAPRAAAVQADLAEEAETETLVGRAAAALGAPISVLVNNAAVFERDEALTATRESWDRHMAVNLRAPFVLSQALARGLAAAHGAERADAPSGLIVNILDQRVWNLTPHFTSYTVSKAGLWTLTQTLALALAPAVRVNAIGPGDTLATPGQSAAHFARRRAGAPLDEGPAPEDVAGALRYLLTARSVTGQMIAVDAGQHLSWRMAEARGDTPKDTGA